MKTRLMLIIGIAAVVGLVLPATVRAAAYESETALSACPEDGPRGERIGPKDGSGGENAPRDGRGIKRGERKGEGRGEARGARDGSGEGRGRGRGRRDGSGRGRGEARGGGQCQGPRDGTGPNADCPKK